MRRTARSDLTARLGEAVRDARPDAGLTQAELAQRLEVHPSYIGGLETGRRNMTVGQLGNLADALGTQLVVAFEPLEDELLSIERR